jgi:uncharacterized membrane protein (DUF485 family)
MTPDDSTIHTIHSIAAKRWRIALILSALMLVFYLGFILLVAFDKPFLSHLLAPGLSVGILLGALTIVSCWILNGIYVVWANRVYDDEVAQVLRSRRTS